MPDASDEWVAIAGGVVGTVLAYGALRVILTLVPPNTIPDESEVAVSVPVLLFTLVVSAQKRVAFDGKMDYLLTVEKQPSSAVAAWWPSRT